ncbi:hypothetical protein AMECASPLE_003683 [Ameca splendens]|uniref:Uncharacterized protein n=1 Tax=Ameca splendens TaxID=208324 RepID=A0ABV0YXP2_9TELE
MLLQALSLYIHLFQSLARMDPDFYVDQILTLLLTDARAKVELPNLIKSSIGAQVAQVVGVHPVTGGLLVQTPIQLSQSSSLLIDNNSQLNGSPISASLSQSSCG